MLPGTRSAVRGRRLPAFTLVELVVTMLLLSIFAVMAFPVFWGASKASTSHSVTAAAQRAKLSLATVLPRFCDEVRPPYWEKADKVFQASGSEWKAFYYEGKESDFLIIRKAGASRLDLVTPEVTVSLDNLKEVSVDWWKQEKRVIGLKVQWRQGNQVMEFHASWGSFIL